VQRTAAQDPDLAAIPVAVRRRYDRDHMRQEPDFRAFLDAAYRCAPMAICERPIERHARPVRRNDRPLLGLVWVETARRDRDTVAGTPAGIALEGQSGVAGRRRLREPEPRRSVLANELDATALEDIEDAAPGSPCDQVDRHAVLDRRVRPARFKASAYDDGADAEVRVPVGNDEPSVDDETRQRWRVDVEHDGVSGRHIGDGAGDGRMPIPGFRIRPRVGSRGGERGERTRGRRDDNEAADCIEASRHEISLFSLTKRRSPSPYHARIMVSVCRTRDL